MRWAIPDGLKFFVILASAFAVTLCLYESLVRRNNLLRILFGMKLKQRSATDVRPVLAEQGV
ncbi:MAG TPA: hypothetical protein VJG32_18795 [Anaerolineae bacterium]|nr:hypothetical protein [Anaerolineae bacterium]